MPKKHIFLGIAGFLVLTTAGWFVSYSVASALSQIPFGGRVLRTINCTCSGGTLVYVGPPRPGTFMKTAATKVYDKKHVSTGRWVLGTAVGYQVCMVYSGNSCTSVGGGPIMTKVGTN